MRILVVTNLAPSAFNPSGGAFLPPRLAGIRSAGHEVVLVGLSPATPAKAVMKLVRHFGRERDSTNTGRAAAALAAGGWNSVSARISTREYLTARSGDWSAGVPALARAVDAAVDVESFDLIHGHGAYMFPAAAVAREVALRGGLPYVVTAHGSDINYTPQKSIELLQRVFGEAQAAFFVSEDLRLNAQRSGISNEFSYVTPNGVDPEVFTPSAADRQPSRLSFVGNFAHVKGADRLPAVMAEVWRRRPDCELHLVGSGPLESALRRELTSPLVTFKGRMDAAGVADEMAKTSVLLLPSRSEGWPTVVLEAQACGARVVATRVCGTTEAVGSGGQLVSADPFDPASFAEAVTEQLELDDRKALVSRATEYSWSALGRIEASLLTEAAARHKVLGSG